jgi:hypothetical protein
MHNMGSRYFSLFLFIISLSVTVLIPFKIWGYNFMPPSDAKRHVGKVFADKGWSEILVMREEFAGFDHNRGWHSLLRAVQILGLNAEELLFFSVAFTFFIFVGTGWLIFGKNPTAWMGAMSIGVLTGSPTRFMQGRPFLLSSAAFLFFQYVWDKDTKWSSVKRAIITFLVMFPTVYLHGGWHLFALLPIVLLGCGRIRDAILAGLAWIFGSVSAGILTLRPMEFLYKQLMVSFASTGEADRLRFLVAEYQPVISITPLLILAVVLLLPNELKKMQTHGIPTDVMAVLICWVLGVMNGRFWWDWGNVALMYVLAKRFSTCSFLQSAESPKPGQAAAVGFSLALGMWLLFTVDVNSRWSNHDFVDSLRLDDPDHVDWLPEEGGILFSNDMTVFYDTFFHNPRAGWRYILGFEATFMPEEDLEIFRNIQFFGAAHPNVFDPWVERMTYADRLILRGVKASRPPVEGLEWNYIAFRTWSGRLPREAGTESIL